MPIKAAAAIVVVFSVLAISKNWRSSGKAGAFMAMRITINRSLNRGEGFSKGGKRSSAGGDSVSIKLYRY